MKENILWISFYVPYDNVAHAGGKNHNYYLKEMAKDEKFNINLLSFFDESEEKKIDLENYNLTFNLYPHIKNKKGILGLISKVTRKLNPFEKHDGMIFNYYRRCIIKHISKLSEENYNPKYIFFQWTQASFFIPYVQKVFPNAYYVMIEEDVYFQGMKRRVERIRNPLIKFVFKLRLKNLKKFEIKLLKLVDGVFVFNNKDVKLIEMYCGKSKIQVLSPYFDSFSCVEQSIKNKKDIIFYGAMNREENSESAIWFVENVMPKLRKTKKGFRFVVVGNKPPDKLLRFASDDVIVTGFVDNPTSYFQNSLCMVAPLLFGAGIKIKILEAMSSGIPVITNEIGIEGIAASKDEDYLFANSSDEYFEAILKLHDCPEKAEEISQKSISFIEKNFCMEKSVEDFKEMIEKLTKHG